MLASDFMDTRFNVLHPQQTIAEAVSAFQEASAGEKKKIFGMMVTDDDDRLVDMLSMYDILLFLRPKHIHIWGAMEDIDIDGLIEHACERAKSILVGDIMTTEVITVSPDTHLMMILDIMIKKHIRRIPVLEEDRILGIVYISNLFYNLVEKLI